MQILKEKQHVSALRKFKDKYLGTKDIAMFF